MLFVYLQQRNCARVVYIAQFILRKTPALSGLSCKNSHVEPLMPAMLKCAPAHRKPYCQAIPMSSTLSSDNDFSLHSQYNFSLDEIFIFTKFILKAVLFIQFLLT